MPATSELSVAGFPSFARLDRLRLTERNILIGANGSGKSNVVEIFHLLGAIRDGRLERYVARAGGAEPVLHHGAGTSRQASLRVLFDEGRSELALVLKPTDDQRLFVEGEVTVHPSAGRFGVRSGEPGARFRLPPPVSERTLAARLAGP